MTGGAPLGIRGIAAARGKWRSGTERIMKLHRNLLFALLFLTAAGLSGCRRNIVRAAPPSVVSPPDSEPFPQPTVVNPQPAAAPAEPPDVKTPAQPRPVVAEQPRPRPPVETEVAPPKPQPEPEPLQNAPHLSPQPPPSPLPPP